MRVKIGLIAFIILGLSYTFYQVFIQDDPSMMSEKEAEAIVGSLYGGEILSTKLNKEKSEYLISLDHDEGVYQLVVDGETQKVSNVKLIERKKNLLTMEEAKKEIELELSGKVNQIKKVSNNGKQLVEAKVSKNDKDYKVEYDLEKKMIVTNKEIKKSENIAHISEQKAKSIALQEIKGEVKNVTILNTQNGKHYKVTVDGPTEGAHIYVQANTGVISSTSWYSKKQPEDDNDDEDEDDDEDDESDNDDDSEEDDNQDD